MFYKDYEEQTEKNLFVWVNKCSQHTRLLGTSELHEVLRHRVNKELCLQFHKYQVHAADISILSRPAFTLEHASYIKMVVYALSGSSVFLVYPPVNSWGYEVLCIDPRLARSYKCCLEKSKQELFPPFIIRSKIWILFTFANTRSGYAWVQLIHCSSLFTITQTSAACSSQLSPNSLVGTIYWAINSSDSVITTVFAQIKVEREKDF